MTIRTKIVALLSGALLFGVSAAAFAVFNLVRAGDELRRVAEIRVPLLGVLSEVTAGHLEQSIRFERALRFGAGPAGSAYADARAEFEGLAAAIWKKLQEGQAIADRAAQHADEERPNQEAESVLALFRRLDVAHNEYAHSARAVFASLDAGRRSEALQLAMRIEEQGDRFDQELGNFLVDASSFTQRASARAKANERRAILVSGGLSILGIIVGAVAVGLCVRLGSRIKFMSGLLPMCATCKSIRDDGGYWNQLEAFLEKHSEAQFTHGLCANCQKELYRKTESMLSDGEDMTD